MHIAGVDAQIVDAVSSIAIMALHSLRALHFEPRAQLEYDELVRRIESGALPCDRQELVVLAQQTGAVATLQPLFERLGVRVEPAAWELASHDYATWSLVATKRERNPHLWLLAFAEQPLARKPLFAFRVVWPSRHDMLVNTPGLADTAREVRRARLSRLTGAMRALPGSTVALIRWWRSRR